MLTRLFVLSILVLGNCPELHAQSRSPMIELADAEQGSTLLVETLPGGNAGEVLFSPVSPEQFAELGEAARDDHFFRLVLSPRFGGLPPLWVTVGGRLGVSFLDQALEVGADAGVIFSVGAGAEGGAYVNVAPVPGEVGRRFYAHGKAYRAFLLTGVSDERSSLRVTDLSMGYRHPRWYLEAGLQKIRARDDRFLLPMLTFGLTSF